MASIPADNAQRLGPFFCTECKSYTERARNWVEPGGMPFTWDSPGARYRVVCYGCYDRLRITSIDSIARCNPPAPSATEQLYRVITGGISLPMRRMPNGEARVPELPAERGAFLRTTELLDFDGSTSVIERLLNLSAIVPEPWLPPLRRGRGRPKGSSDIQESVRHTIAINGLERLREGYSWKEAALHTKTATVNWRTLQKYVAAFLKCEMKDLKTAVAAYLTASAKEEHR